MDDNKLRFGVGVLVIAAIGLGIILTFLFGAFPTVLSREYELLVEFPSAEGVSTNTPVLRDGVRIGRVADITLLEKEGVLLRLAMDADRKISHEYIPRISTGSVITGDATLEFVRADPQALMAIFPNVEDRELIPEPFTDSEYIRYGRKAKDPFNVLFEMESEMQTTMQSIRQAGESIEQAGQGFAVMVQDVQNAVGTSDEQFERVANQAVDALEEFQGAMREVRTLLGDPEMNENLDNAIEMLPQVLEEAQVTFSTFQGAGDQLKKVGVAAEKTVSGADEAVASIRDAAKSADRSFQGAERAIANFEEFSEPLGERGEELVTQVLRTMRNADSALSEIRTFTSALNNNDGSLRRLLEDEELYWQIRRLMSNVEQASSRIRPILDDVRIFTDKIARDPRQLGVRGAITKRPNGMGLK